MQLSNGRVGRQHDAVTPELGNAVVRNIRGRKRPVRKFPRDLAKSPYSGQISRCASFCGRQVLGGLHHSIVSRRWPREQTLDASIVFADQSTRLDRKLLAIKALRDENPHPDAGYDIDEWRPQ
jgi:hypothetical protein